MNERIKKLAEQAGFDFDGYYDNVTQEELERFAELVRQDEREACAKLCENVVSNEGYVQSKWCAKAIRGRTE